MLESYKTLTGLSPVLCRVANENINEVSGESKPGFAQVVGGYIWSAAKHLYVDLTYLLLQRER